MGNRNSHEQRQSSFASFVVTSTSTNPNEELENYICSMDNDTNQSTTAAATTTTPPKSPIQIKFQPFLSPLNNNNNNNNVNTSSSSSRSQLLSATTNEQLIIYAAPIIQMQLSSRCKETIDRLKELKKEKSVLLAVINPQTAKIPVKQRDSASTPQSEKKILNQMNEVMKTKYQLRLIELEESVLLAQQDLLKSNRPSTSSMNETEQDGQKSTTKNIKALWRDAFRALKASTSASGTGDDENRSSFVRRISSRKKKRSTEREREREEDQPVIDPVYETLKVAAETRKRAVAVYLQQRQQMLNKQTSLNSQGSSEPDIQPSPRVIRQRESAPGSSDNSRGSNNQA